MIMNEVICEDVQDFSKHFDLTAQLSDTSFLITGATGLIGSSLIRCLLALDARIKIVAPVRNLKKAEALFDESQKKDIRFIECDLLQYDYGQIDSVDYIIHCAAPTASRFFVEHPVETFGTIMDGSKKMLDVACQKKVKSMVYLSSLEIYGEIQDDSVPVAESVQGYLDPMSVRSCYPMAKRATENLCCLYAQEYGTPVKIARLTQTTGAGIAKDDNRIIAQFARLAAQGQDIVLHTTGESARPYCYVTDTVSAILYILLKGKNGDCYNVANESTYVSAKGMAEFVRENINPKIQVRLELDDNQGYAPPTKHKLSTKKLEQLGWKPRYDLKKIFERLVSYLT